MKTGSIIIWGFLVLTILTGCGTYGQRPPIKNKNSSLTQPSENSNIPKENKQPVSTSIQK